MNYPYIYAYIVNETLRLNITGMFKNEQIINELDHACY